MNDMHSQHDQANVLFLQGLEDAMLRLQRGNRDHGQMAAVQQPAMPVVCGQAHTTNKAATDTQSAGYSTNDSGIRTGSRVWVNGIADTGAGSVEGNGSAAVG